MHSQKHGVTLTAPAPSFRFAHRGCLQRKCDCCQHTIAGGECAECRKKRKSGMPQREATHPSSLISQPSDVLPIVHDVLRPPGQPLDAATRAFMEPGFRHDFSHVRVQPKLTVGAPNDKYEQEADRVAEQVTRMAVPKALCQAEMSYRMEDLGIQQSCPSCSNGDPRAGDTKRIAIMTKALDGGSCESAPSGDKGEEEQEEETSIMPKARSGGLDKPSQLLEQRLLLTRGGGSPLPNETRSFMESRFGHDFSAVRVHTDHRATFMTEKLNAEAFTSGRDVYFREGRYDPLSLSGKRLLAHELTHVVQQSADLHAKCIARADSRARHNHIQCFKLNGFPPTEEAAMKAAVPAAISAVKSCSELSWYGKRDIPIALNSVRYDYVPDLGLCGWTFPTSWYIEIGKQAFESRCCDLPSTLAHEASHTVFYTESRARKMECNCFGCSCPKQPASEPGDFPVAPDIERRV